MPPPRVVALLASYNERRFIGVCIEHLIANGIEVYVCDNESTDDTVAIAEGFRGRGLVGIETVRRDGTYRWRHILARKEQLAVELDADWFLHLDPDEIFVSNVRGETLLEAIAAADAAGYNAIDFNELNFVPTRECPDHDHPEFRRTMRWYYPFAPRPLHRVNAWKRQEKVDLVSTGGHQAKFRGRRISPRKLNMCHYLILSREHAVRKYVQRRYDADEVERGWHGWRARITENDIHLPSQSDLRFAADDFDLDPSSPRRKEFVEWPVRPRLTNHSSGDPRPAVLCIVDEKGWAHDRKTDALIASLEREYRLIKRFQSEVTEADIDAADLVLVYYWLQIDRLVHLRPAFERNRDRLLIGVCGEAELGHIWRNRGLAMLSRLPRAVFVNNRTLLERLRPTLGRELFYTPNGVDTNFFRPPATLPSGTLRVGWAGSLENHTPEHRGVDAFIAPAVAAVEGAELCVAAREDRWRNAEEMREFYQSLHVYVCASASEGTPNPCFEAAACGVPIITTAVGAMPEFIRDGENGWIVPREVAAIAARLRVLRDDPALRQKMGNAARASAESWDWRDLAQRYGQMFRRILEGRVPYAPARSTRDRLRDAIMSSYIWQFGERVMWRLRWKNIGP